MMVIFFCLINLVKMHQKLQELLEQLLRLSRVFLKINKELLKVEADQSLIVLLEILINFCGLHLQKL